MKALDRDIYLLVAASTDGLLTIRHHDVQITIFVNNSPHPLCRSGINKVAGASRVNQDHHLLFLDVPLHPHGLRGWCHYDGMERNFWWILVLQDLLDLVFFFVFLFF